MSKLWRFSDLAKTLHPDRFLGVEFGNEVHFQKCWKFHPQNGQKGAKKAIFWSFSNLAKILHPDRFLGVEFENEVHFRKCSIFVHWISNATHVHMYNFIFTDESMLWHHHCNKFVPLFGNGYVLCQSCSSKTEDEVEPGAMSTLLLLYFEMYMD